MPVKLPVDRSVSEAAVEHVDRSMAKVESSAPLYTCPMHPEVQQDHPGNCPKCGMTLEPKTENRQWDARQVKYDEFLAPAGHVLDSMLSEHQCEGWLEGYLLTGRHGLFNSYEAFIRIIDSMFSQHAKWLKVCGTA